MIAKKYHNQLCDILSQYLDVESQINRLKYEILQLQREVECGNKLCKELKHEMMDLMESEGVISDRDINGYSLTIVQPKAATRVNILDENVLPEEVLKVERKVDKTLIKKAIEQGKKVQGAELVKKEKSLLIKHEKFKE